MRHAPPKGAEVGVPDWVQHGGFFGWRFPCLQAKALH